jgi:hypothetical protein
MVLIFQLNLFLCNYFMLIISAKFSKLRADTDNLNGKVELESYYVKKIFQLMNLVTKIVPLSAAFVLLCEPRLPVLHTSLIPEDFPCWPLILFPNCLLIFWFGWCCWISTLFCMSLALDTPIIYARVQQQLKYAKKTFLSYK